jgi:PAS domain S-box-containing protein
LKKIRRQSAARPTSAQKVATLQSRLAVAEETLRAIRSGEVDSVVVAGKKGDRVFTLEGAEHAYRMLIESMNEGALTLTGDKLILYANQSFARMVKCPLEQVVGSGFRRFLAPADQAALRPEMKRSAYAGVKMQVSLLASDGSLLPVQISVQEIAKDGHHHFTLGMVVTDLTESRRAEELLRALTHRVVQVQEAERAHVALELHDRITQPLVAVLFSSGALAARLSARDGPVKRAALALRNQLGATAGEVERISRNLRPGVLEELGLDAVLRTTTREFTERTGVPVQLAGAPLTDRLPPDTELAIYRILQEALKNVEQHARARHVSVTLTCPPGRVELVFKDDGIGFAAKQHAFRRKGKRVLGLLGMRERAAYVGGTFVVKSGRRAGTEITVQIPLPPDPSSEARAAAR